MPEDPDSPRVVATVATEVEAALVVDQLAAEGIKATSLGASLATIWPQLPREVQIVVRQADFSRAKTTLFVLVTLACIIIGWAVRYLALAIARAGVWSSRWCSLA